MKSDRNPGDGIIDGSDGKIKITTHVIKIHLTGTMESNFIQLSDPIGSDCRIRSDSNTMDPDVVPFHDPMNSIGFRRNPIGSYRIR